MTETISQTGPDHIGNDIGQIVVPPGDPVFLHILHTDTIDIRQDIEDEKPTQ